MFVIKNVELETVCGPTSRLPENSLPELAFAGRSNVGKSSLINVLMQRKSLARTSSKPGKTQTVNFYRVEMKMKQPDAEASAPEQVRAAAADGALRFYLVDLPGYGYAKRSKEESAKWGPMIERYLTRSKQLRAMFLLVDVRLPAQESDLVMLDYARQTGIPRVIVATKADKLKKNELAKQTSVLREAFALSDDEPFITFSAVKNTGQDALYRTIRSFLADPDPG